MQDQPLSYIQSVSHATADDLRSELQGYEMRFAMSTEEFLRRWRSGQHPELDSEEYFEWIGACYMAVRAGVLDGTAATLVVA